MLGRTLNLGILAHVDAGKTTLTERLLYAAGVIDTPGSVDRGTTQTDTLELERQRGITIRSAVVAFHIGDVAVNLIDTPGHPDFIAEVERVLDVLDGAVLVVSAVEGVQAQTIVLMRALQRLRIPTLVFVNKTDRAGADVGRVLEEIRTRIAPEAIATWDVDLERLADCDDALLAAYVDGVAVSPGAVDAALAAQARAARVRPVFAGSAITGEGIDGLADGIVALLPATVRDSGAPPDGVVFKIERGPAGDKVAYVRMVAGTVRVRDRVHGDAKVTALSVFEDSGAVQRLEVSAGQIAKVWGLREIRIGDRIGHDGARTARHRFAPPTLETVVVPVVLDEKQPLRAALEQLAEQDPLIGAHQDESTQELTVSIYGEVQKEVLQATLAADYGLEVTFRATRPIYVERPTGVGEAAELLHAPTNPYNASMALRVEPAPDGSGIGFRLAVDHTSIPLYVYKRGELFAEAMEEYVRDALRSGIYGWRVTDCVVTLTDSAYSLADGPPSRRGPTSKAIDFRKLTPLVLARALARAGTAVCEPLVRARVDVPPASIGAVMAALSRLEAEVDTPELGAAVATIVARLPAVRADDLRRQLAGLTSGEGVLETAFAGYRPVGGAPPVR